jgi:isopentenyl-diphosphate delta-isomerase type 1
MSLVPEHNDVPSVRSAVLPDAEYLDVVDMQGKPVGSIKSRLEVHRDGDWHKTVHIWLMNNRRELLVQQRSAGKETFPGYWDISCAGHRCTGESAVDAALHETSEELGIVLTSDRLEYLFSVTTSSVLHNGTFIDNEIADVFLVRIQNSAAAIRVSAAEVAAVRWIPVAEFMSSVDRNCGSFVPHHEEYERLFSLVMKQLP